VGAQARRGRAVTASGTGEPVVCVADLTRRFGRRTALDSVSLTVARGVVHGLVGANGAGKTTLIRHTLGLLRAESGSVRVFGLDPVAEPVAVLSRVGYLSDQNDLPGWMRVEELLRYSRAFYPAWDDDNAEELRRRFDLDAAARVASLSRGQRARAGLLVALAHRPELLVLDEPSSGLDPIARREILDAVLRAVADEGRTVLFSSHLLDEVEQVADHVTVITRGRIVLSGPLEEIRDSHHAVEIRFPVPRDEPPPSPGVLRWEGRGRDWKALVRGAPKELEAAAIGWGASVVASRAARLDEVFVAQAGGASSPAGDV